MYPSRSALKLEDCVNHGANSGAELFLVEGDSAMTSASAVRDPQFQAVLAMQGKPLNALKASADKVHKNLLFQRLSSALNVALMDESQQTGLAFEPRLANLRYSKVILLFDPDADGIHCSALMQMFFYKWMRPLLDEQRIEMAHYNLDDIKAYRPRGLGSLDPNFLREAYIAPATRQTRTMTVSAAEAAISVFGG
jgi:DNA gyrase subunit B